MVGRDHVVDAGVQMECEVRVEHVGLVADDQGHDQPHRGQGYEGALPRAPADSRYAGVRSSEPDVRATGVALGVGARWAKRHPVASSTKAGAVGTE